MLIAARLVGKRYPPIGLVETSAAAVFTVNSAVQSFYQQRYRRRDPTALRELEGSQRYKNLFFFVDDNLQGSLREKPRVSPAMANVGIQGDPDEH